MSKQVPLSQGKFALVDDEDFDRVSRLKWHISNSGTRIYAKNVQWVNGKSVGMYMHRFILGLKSPKIPVDHRNGDTLDNQKTNLRAATTSQNVANSSLRSVNRSGYKGVSFDKAHRRKWYASICVNGKTLCLGFYNTPVAAALAYDRAAIEHFGEFAKTNFPVPSHSSGESLSNTVPE